MFKLIAFLALMFGLLVAPVTGISSKENAALVTIGYADSGAPVLVTVELSKVKCFFDQKEQHKKKHHAAPHHKKKHHAAPHHHKVKHKPHHHKSHVPDHHKSHQHKISHAHVSLALTGPPGCG